MASPKRQFTDQEQDEMIDMYQSRLAIQKIADHLHTTPHKIKEVLHKKNIKQYPLCKNGCDAIVYSREVCHKCYWHVIQAERAGTKFKKKKDELLDTKDDSIVRMFNAGNSIKKIAKMMGVNDYTVRDELQKAGKLSLKKCENGCDSPVHCKGLCRNCYNRQYQAAMREKQTPEQKRIILNASILELKSKTSRYKCCTMATSLELRVNLHNDIVAISIEIDKLQKELAG